ncbi:MAG TPA: response regulator [Terriglobales bacterium]|nr:response regulator [Terriglobales bacterium]
MAPAIRPLNLLMADDDENDYVLLDCAARRAQLPAQLCWVKDGMELLDYLRGQGRYGDSASYPRPALVLLDLNMPRKNGLDALQEIRQDPGLRSLPVVIFTTSKSEEDIQLGYQAGANSFISKPPEFQRLIEIMEVLRRYWFETVATPAN